MRYLVLLCLLLCPFAFAQEVQKEISEIDVEKFCSGPEVVIDGVPFTVNDQGFCKELDKIKKENQEVDEDFIEDITYVLNEFETINLIKLPCQNIEREEYHSNFGKFLNNEEGKDKWKLRFYASHSFTTYFDTDLKVSSTRINGTIEDYTWTERSSRKFFNPKTWMEKGNNPFQIIDEPTNTFTLSLEKDGNEFFLSAFHPKFFQEDQVKHFTGTVDGTPVNAVVPINKPFDGYNQVPGEMELVRNQNTHQEMIFEVGYGHRFKLLEGKAGSLIYTPSIGAGLTIGSNFTVIVKEGDWWEFDDYSEKLSVQGYGGSISNRLEYNTPNQKFGLFYENKFGFYKQKHGFLDGTQEYNLKFMGNSVGMVFMLYNPKNKKKVEPSF